MRKDIENIDTYETRTKVNIKNGGQSMNLQMKLSKTFPGYFIKECKNNSNQAQFTPAK